MSPPILKVLFVWLALAQILPAAAYMKIGDIKGESTDASYPGWIIIESLQFSGSIFDGAAGSFGVAKHVDRSSPLLIKALERGRFLPRVTIAFLKPHPTDSTADEVEFARLLFRDVRIDSCRQTVSSSATGATEALENFQFSFRAVLYRYTPNASAPEEIYSDLDQGKDSDSDGMTDNYEKFFDLDEKSDDSALDSDGDGLTNLEEFRLGLNPRLSSSAFVPRGEADPEDPQKFRLTWATKPAKSYDIYLTPDLGQAPVFQRRVTASELDTSSSFGRNQPRGFFSIREVVE